MVYEVIGDAMVMFVRLVIDGFLKVFHLFTCKSNGLQCFFPLYDMKLCANVIL